MSPWVCSEALCGILFTPETSSPGGSSLPPSLCSCPPGPLPHLISLAATPGPEPHWGNRGGREGTQGWGLGGLGQSQNWPINSSLSPAGSQARLLHSRPQQQAAPGPQASLSRLSPGALALGGLGDSWRGGYRSGSQLGTVAIDQGSTWSLLMLSNPRQMILAPRASVSPSTSRMSSSKPAACLRGSIPFPSPSNP